MAKNVENLNISRKLVTCNKNCKMGSLTISNKVLDKYFGYLKDLDNKAKKSLINKLTESISKSKKEFDLNKMFGGWSDNKSSDEIISEIKNSRVNKGNIESFE